MRTRTLVALLSCVALGLCLYFTPSAGAASAEEEIIQVETNFIKAINTGDNTLMSSLYWQSPKTSTFNPVSNPFLSQSNESSLKTSEVTSTASAHNLQVVMLKDDVAVLTGYECVIDTNTRTNEQNIYNLRFTRVVQKINGKWQIVHDHASQLPIQ